MKLPFSIQHLFLGSLLLASLATAYGQTWRTVSGTNWSTAANWGGVLPSQDGTADLVFSAVGDPSLTRGDTTLDADWNVRSLFWNSTALDSGNAYIRGSSTLSLQNGLTNASGGHVTISPNIVVPTAQVWNDNSLTSNNSGPGTTVIGVISGNGSITKTGNGSLYLKSAVNTYTGGTTLSEGKLVISGDQSLGSGTLTWAGGFLDGELGKGARTISNNVSLLYGRVGGNEALTFTGAVDLGGASNRVIRGQTAVTTFTNTISNGGLNLQDGNFAFQGMNTYTGGLVLTDSGKAIVANDANLGGASNELTFIRGTLSTTSTFSTARSMTFRPEDGGTIDTAADTTLTVTGTVQGPAGIYGTMTKKGAGTLVFSGADKMLNSMSVIDGALLLDNTGSTAGPYTYSRVYSGATFGGTGSVGTLYVFTGSHFAPGGEYGDVMNVNGYLQLAGGSNIDFALGVTSSDQIQLADSPWNRFSGAPDTSILVNISDAGGLNIGQSYTLIDGSSAAATDLDASDFYLNSSPIDGTFSVVNNSLVFTTVPEPSSLLFALAGLCPFLLLLRKRLSPSA
jgi:autotransporter-associated beta strand protein